AFSQRFEIFRGAGTATAGRPSAVNDIASSHDAAPASRPQEGVMPRFRLMKTPFLALLILGSAISTAQAQVSQEWVARYASLTPYNDVPYAMTVDADGHVYVTGTTATTGAND